MQEGFFGMLGAAEKYDVTKGVKFSTYATSRIRGQILDYLRRIDDVPRLTRHHVKIAEAAQEALEAQVGGHVPDDAVQKKAGLSMMQYLKVQRVLKDKEQEHNNREYQPLNGNQKEETPLGIREPFNPVFDSIAKRDATNYVFRLIGEIIDAGKIDSERKRVYKNVFELRYKSGLTLKAIGKQLGLSESRVYQIQAKYLGMVRLLENRIR